MKKKNNVLSNQIYSRINHVKKRKRSYNNFLKDNSLNSQGLNFVSELDKKNILLKNFNYLIRLNGLKEIEYIDHMNLIRLVSNELFNISTNSIDAETVIQLDEIVEGISDRLNLVVSKVNIEKEIIKVIGDVEPYVEYKVFSFDKVYNRLATVFAAPFIHSEHYFYYYSYGYLLSMYLNLFHFVNKEKILEDQTVFTAKLLVQEKMIDAIRKITPKYYNTFIIKTNLWISRIDFKKVNGKGGDE